MVLFCIAGLPTISIAWTPSAYIVNNKSSIKPIHSFFFTCRNFELGVGSVRIDCPKLKQAFTKESSDELCTSVCSSCQSFCSCLTQTALVWVGEVAPCRARRWQVGSTLQGLTWELRLRKMPTSMKSANLQQTKHHHHFEMLLEWRREEVCRFAS